MKQQAGRAVTDPGPLLMGQPIELGSLVPSGYRFRHPPLNILFVCDDRYPASVVSDHIRALREYSRHRFFVVNPYRIRGRIPLRTSFDAIVIHYSILIISEAHLPTALRDVIGSFPGLKIQFIQDEYRWINRIVAQMQALGIHVVFSALRPHTARAVYCDHAGLRDRYLFSTLSGYVPDYLEDVQSPPIRERALHVTYRSRELPFWLGKHSRQKQEIADGFRSIADAYGLRVNISTREDERLYGQQWIDLIKSGKAVLGTEGGASIFDFDSTIQEQTDAYLRLHPTATFEEVHQNVLAPYEGNIVHGAFTPRLLEAIALKTALVLFPGKYAGILQPDRHYIPLRQDFSNGAEVAAKLQDDELLQSMVDRAYDDVIRPGDLSFRTFVARFDMAIDLALQSQGRGSVPDTGADLASSLRTSNHLGLGLRFKLERLRLVRTFSKVDQFIRRVARS